MAEARKPSKILEAESNVQVLHLIQRVEEVTGKGAVEANKDIVAFVGPTKAGKSTLINCLLGTPLICKKDEATADTFIVKAPEIPGPEIGGSGQSETEKPESYQNVPGTSYVMWDFAGFGDNKGTEQEIANAISYQTILRPQKSVRFVLVAPCETIKSNDPLSFYKLLYELQKICPQIADSLCIVSTKGERAKVEKLLEKTLSYEFSKAEKSNLDIIRESKKIIKKVLENGTCIDFRAPVLEEEVDEEPFTLPNKQQFIDCIKRLEGTKVVDMPLLISDKAKHDIAELYTIFYHAVKKEVDETNILIEKYIQRKIDEVTEAKDDDGNPTSAASRLAVFKMGKRTIEDVLKKSKNFKEFFGEIKKAGVGINERFSENIDKFIFVETLKNMYKKSIMYQTEASVKGEKEFFANIQVALNSGASKYSALIATSEAASEEEKRKEEEWQNLKNEEINTLKEQIKKLEKHNDSVLVKAAQFIVDTPVVQAMSRMATDVAETIKDKCVIS